MIIMDKIKLTSEDIDYIKNDNQLSKAIMVDPVFHKVVDCLIVGVDKSQLIDILYGICNMYNNLSYELRKVYKQGT